MNESASLLPSINETEEASPASSTPCFSCGCLAQYAYSTIVSTALGVACFLIWMQLLAVQYQLRKEEEEIQQLENEIQHQAPEIEHISERVEQEHQATLYHLAGTFVLIGGLITMFHMRQHIENMHVPSVQRKVLAILAMSPIYSTTSFLSLVFPSISEYLSILKDCYEAYVIYQFLSFLIAVLGKGDRSVVVELLSKHADHLKAPLACLNCLYYPDPDESDEAMANAVILECQVFTLQFVFLRPILSITLFVLEMMRDSDEPMPTWDLKSPKLYITLVQNISVFCAFRGLLKFYHAVHEFIEWIQPLPKFLCIKGIVFLTFWQSMLLNVFANAGSSEGGEQDPDEWADEIQNLLICLEMLGFSIAHFFVFPTEEWEEGFIRRRLDMSVGDSIAFGDFISDVKLVVNSSRSARANRSDRKDYGSTVGSTSTIPSEDIESDVVEGLGDNDVEDDGDGAGGFVEGMDVLKHNR